MKRTLTAAVAGVALAGLIGAGVAVADDGFSPGQRLDDVLSGLVGDGTLSQDQADELTDALTQAREKAQEEREQRQSERRAEVDALLQDTIGMDAEALHEQLRDGKTLLEIAGDSADELAAGALDLLAANLDRAVEDGWMTQERVETVLTQARERADAWLAGEEVGPDAGLGLLMGPGGFGPGPGAEGHKGRGPGGSAGMGPGGIGAGGMGPGHGGQGFRQGPRGWDDGDSSAPSGSASATNTSWAI